MKIQKVYISFLDLPLVPDNVFEIEIGIVKLRILKSVKSGRLTYDIVSLNLTK